jgi:hypothetical protein
LLDKFLLLADVKTANVLLQLVHCPSFFNWIQFALGIKVMCKLKLNLFRTMRSWDPDVVLVRRTIDLKCWEFGMGRDGEGMGRG